MTPILEQRALISEEGKLMITIESPMLHKGETVVVVVTPVAPTKGQLSALIGAAKGCFKSEQDVDNFINDFRGE